ncbi:hypothetical protein ACHAWF_014630 [Thalassiosira exigua]
MTMKTLAALALALSHLGTSAEAFSPSLPPNSMAASSCARRPSQLAATEQSTDAAVVIGGGRIGSLLASSDSSSTTLLGRSDPLSSNVDPAGSGPVYVATRNDVLDSVVDDCPPSRRKDLVFLQNGYLDDFLKSKGLSDNTQVLLYGADPIDGITSANPEGLTAATGVHARAFADRLASLGLKCNVVSGEEYRPAMFEKLIWIATYMLVGTARGCSTVGEAGSSHGDLVRSVVSELVSATADKEGIAFPPGTIERLEAYTDVVADFPCGVKEFEWRNRYFYDLGDDACPMHNGLLRECAEGGKLGFDLP